MGSEFAQRREWTHEDSLEWHVIGHDKRHEGVQRWLADLNRVYRAEPALHRTDFTVEGFRWVQRGDWEASVLAYLRVAPDSAPILVVCNFTPVARHNYRVGVPRGGKWREILNSDAQYYGGSGVGNQGGADAQPMPYEEYNQSLTLTLPPLAVLVFKPD
jgi:1,4-alpha-glucan branching enzyme